MTTREAKEDALQSDIATAVTDAQVEVFPDNLRDFKSKKDKVILVGWFGKNRLSKVNQRGTLQNYNDRFIVQFGYRNRRTHKGLLADLATVEDTLAGKKIDNNFLGMTSERFVEFNDADRRWVFQQEYELFERYDNR